MRNNYIINLLIVCSVIFSLFSCKKKSVQNQTAGPVPVVEFTVRPQKVNFYDSYPGTVVALNEVELHSQVSGFITGIYFKEGSLVKKGDKLYEIDRRKYQAAFDEARNNKDIAEANLQKYQRDADRYSKLNEQNAIAKQTYDDAITNLQNTRTQLLSAQAALLNTETDFNYSVITSPFSGTIGFSLVKPGTFINSGQTLLNTISSDDPIGVDFIINERSLPGFIAMQKNKAAGIDSTFSITLPDNSFYPFYGELSVIDRGVDPQTGTIKIRLVFPNHERSLRPGMNCRIKVLGGNSGEQLVIPYKAVIEQMGEYFVYLIDSMKVKQVKIIPGSNLGEQIVVRQGVKPGDKIVLEGLQKVHNGSIVQIGSPSGKQEMIKR
jgi:membrane fusion protein, multidrug efflux system